MLDCNRHRTNGYRDKTWVHRVSDQNLETFHEQREADRDRSQNIINQRFPSLAEARDQYMALDTESRSEDSDRSVPEVYDTSSLPRKEVSRMYRKNKSPKVRSTKQVVVGGVDRFKTVSVEPKHPVTKLSALGKQTLTHSLKTRSVIKNNFGMPRLAPIKFNPANGAEAKDSITHHSVHDTELEPNKPNPFEKPSQKLLNGLSDPLFASKLEKMDKLTSNVSLSKMMFSNQSLERPSKKVSLYDYQKIQSTQHGSQILGQRHFLMGWPTSGFH